MQGPRANSRHATHLSMDPGFTLMAERAQPGHLDQHLMALLRRDGCPICAESAADESSYLSWFFIETYAFPEALSECRQALGFCVRHASRVMRYSGCSDQISYVHSDIVRHALKLLDSQLDSADQRRMTLLTAPAPCPACASLQAGERRMSFFLAKLLHGPSGFQNYGNPGSLCFPHLQILSNSMPSKLLQHLLTIHGGAMQSALERMDATRSTAPGGRLPENLVTPIESSLRLTVGHRPGATILPTPDAVSRDHTFRDPIGEFIASMKREDGCPICFEVARAWREWIGWLEHAAHTPEVIADLLPTCGEHAWACADLCGPQLALAVAANTLRVTLSQVRNAKNLFAAPVRGKAESRLGYAWRTFWQTRAQPAQARQIIGLAVDCPVCRRLAAARDRAIHLLFALLEEQRYRTAFEAGYGLCLKHFSRALALQPRDRIRVILIEVELAKLTSLQWELTEYARKARWDARPERPGTESAAWKKSIKRFSGYLTQ